ncbi:MAG: hypothetical protein HRF43_15455 [Phycisphaerae bacterium]
MISRPSQYARRAIPLMFLLPTAFGVMVAAQTYPASAPASAPSTRPAGPTVEQIRQTIRQLSHPVHARRRAAVRQLAEWGPVAFPELRTVARSGDTEAALSAQELLRELRSAILIGAEVRLEVDRSKAAWNQPITLIVHARNPSSEAIVVPWPAAEGPVADPALADARQVGALLDAGDFLIVTGPDGEPIDPRVDPIEREPLVYEAVNQRARGTPPSHPMPPGATDVLRIPDFNRGWARYALLAPGRYTITFSYQPEWNDPSWTRQGFGLVRSRPVTVEITEPAPERIRKADTPLALSIRRQGGVLLAELESTWDRDLSVNLNFGDQDQTHAGLEWRIVFADAKPDEDSIRWRAEDRPAPYAAEKVRRIRPGEKVAIGQASVEDLLNQVPAAAREAGRPVEVFARYVHLPTPQQIRDALAERKLPAEVPRDLFSGSAVSETIPLEAQ